MQIDAPSVSRREDEGLIEMGDKTQYEQRVIKIHYINIGYNERTKLITTKVNLVGMGLFLRRSIDLAL